MEIFRLFGSVLVDSSGADKALDNTDKKAQSVTSRLGEFIKTAAKWAAGIVASISTGIVALGKIGIDYNTEMETYTTNFETLLGSQEAAVKKVEELKKFAASTPLSMADLSQATQTLLAFGVESEKSTKTLKMLGDIALGDSAKLQSLATAFGKAKSQGKLTGEIVQSMISAGWNPLLDIMTDTGESMDAVQKRLSEGAISFVELERAIKIATTGSGKFAGGMEKASKTTAGLMSTLKDNARALVGEVFLPISNALLETVLPTAIDSVAGLTDSFRESGIDGMIRAAGDILGNLLAKLSEFLPDLIQKVIDILDAVISGIVDNLSKITESAATIIAQLTGAFINLVPTIVQAGVDIIDDLIDGITKALPTLIPAARDAVLQIANTLTNPNSASDILKSALDLVQVLANGIIDSIPVLVAEIPKIITNIVTTITDNFPQILEVGGNIIVNLVSAIGNALPDIIESGKEAISSYITAIKDYFPKVLEIGGEIVSNLVKAIGDALPDIIDAGEDVVSGIIEGVK